MDLSIYTLSVTVFLLVFSLWIVGFLRKFRNNGAYPPLVGTMLSHVMNFERLHDYHTEQAERCKTFRVMYPTFSYVFTTDPINVEHILKTNFTNYVKGISNHEIMRDLLGDGIFNVDGDKWRQQRKLAGLEFSTKVFMDFSGVVFSSIAVKLASIFKEAAEEKKCVEMQDLFMRSSFDAICKVVFGVDINSLSSTKSRAGPETSFAEAFDVANAMMFHRYVGSFWKVKKVFNIGSEAILRKNIKIVDDFLYKVIEIRRQEVVSAEKENVKPDILSRYITLSDKESSETFSDKYLRDFILNFMMAARDTTALTLSWFLYMLCKHPQVQEKIVKEISSVIEDTESTDIGTFAHCLTHEVLDKMHYLHASLSETLRLYPAVPVDGKYVVKDDILPDGFKVNKGDFVSYVPYAMGRMAFLWGNDAKEFKPERWIENGVFHPQSPFKFTAFQAGPRICIGRDFAYLQMKIIAAVLLRFYKFEMVKPKEIRYRTMLTLHMDEDGLNLSVSPRL
ncbi:hypothetical protein SUGI_0497490 [Cryptomeria japonica]|uniref:cytochrome P450 704C1 n=1 Tax=Cryptomeria japonica TaxID=3369 RepID=UPI0024089BFC|nr:cytochrome P450 704C1 [Cryptomeria japonica]GLJ25952.1 hypothetical protein SUGI_0497490 [Cryptomeria japonica]